VNRLRASIALMVVLLAGVTAAAFAGGAFGGDPSPSSLLETPTPTGPPPTVTPTLPPPTETPTQPPPTDTTSTETQPPADCPPRRKKGAPPGNGKGPKDCRPKAATAGNPLGGGL
jgi:hypothetical protein